MAIDVRCNIICSLGQVISGNVGDDLRGEPGLARTTGTVVIEGLHLPARGTEVQLAYHRPQAGTITRFPRRLRVMRATADPYRNITTVELGCLLALRFSVADRAATLPLTLFLSTGYISAQAALAYCLQKAGIPLASGSRALLFRFFRDSIDLSSGYLSVANDLIKSECCWGVLNAAEQLVIQKIDLSAATTAGVLGDYDLIDLQPVTGGQDPADEATVNYSQFGR
jgi:hypothetical protein